MIVALPATAQNRAMAFVVGYMSMRQLSWHGESIKVVTFTGDNHFAHKDGEMAALDRTINEGDW